MAKVLKDLPLKELCIKLHILRYIWLYKVCNFMHKFQAILVLEFEDLTSTSWCSNWIQEWIKEHSVRINLGTYLNTFRIVANDLICRILFTTNTKILYFSFILLQNLFSKYMYHFHLSKNAQHSVGTNSRHASFSILCFNDVLNVFNLNPFHEMKKRMLTRCSQGQFLPVINRSQTIGKIFFRSFYSYSETLSQ